MTRPYRPHPARLAREREREERARDLEHYRYGIPTGRRDASPAKDAEDAIDWPQIFVVGSVLAVSGWAVWKFFLDPKLAQAAQAKANGSPLLSPATPSNVPTPNLGLDPVPASPDLPSEVIVIPPSARPATKAIQFLGDPVLLRPSQPYRARLQLGSLEAAFATRDMITAQFQALGFTNLQAFQSPSELPPDWPAETTANPGKGTWWIQGTFTGQETNMPRPAQISLVWEQ